MGLFSGEIQLTLVIRYSFQVNGVAQLHSDILKKELFSDFFSLWPTKFQNKTNGVTPRRWLRFCSPELSAIITKWLRTDEWVTNLDLLTGLRKVRFHIRSGEAFHVNFLYQRKKCPTKIFPFLFLDLKDFVNSFKNFSDVKVKCFLYVKRLVLPIRLICDTSNVPVIFIDVFLLQPLSSKQLKLLRKTISQIRRSSWPIDKEHMFRRQKQQKLERPHCDESLQASEFL